MKITIKLLSGFYALSAEPIEILGFNFALHRTLNKSGWTITEPRSGLALVTKAKSREQARASVLDKINTLGVDKFRTLVGQHSSLPNPEGLPEYVAQVKPKPVKADISKIVELVANSVGGLSDAEKIAVARALNSRTGQLKAKAPSAFGDAEERLAAAAWQGLQPNGYKIGLVSVFAIGHHADSQALWEKLCKHRWPAAFDKDKLALVNAGVW